MPKPYLVFTDFIGFNERLMRQLTSFEFLVALPLSLLFLLAVELGFPILLPLLLTFRQSALPLFNQPLVKFCDLFLKHTAIFVMLWLITFDAKLSDGIVLIEAPDCAPTELQKTEFRSVHEWICTHTHTLRQLCDDARNTVLIENNGVAQKWVATPFWSNSILFHKNTIASIDDDAWCKRALMIPPEYKYK